MEKRVSAFQTRKIIATTFEEAATSNQDPVVAFFATVVAALQKIAPKAWQIIAATFEEAATANKDPVAAKNAAVAAFTEGLASPGRGQGSQLGNGQIYHFTQVQQSHPGDRW